MTNEDVIRAILSVLSVDKEVVPQEKEFLSGVCKRLNISREEYSQIFQKIKTEKKPIYIPTEPSDKTFLFTLLLQAAFSDGKFSLEEQRILNTFSSKIGMSQSELQEAIDSYKPSLPEALPHERNIQSKDTLINTGIDNELQKQILCKQILNWKDCYKTRIEEELTNAFPALEFRLKEVVNNNILNMIKDGPKRFTAELLEPEIITWVKSHTEPLLQNAQEDLTQIVNHTINATTQFHQGSLGNENTNIIGADMLAPIAAIIAGIGTMVAGVAFSITTFLWVFTMINWPLLIGGLVVGGALSFFGVVKIAQLKDQLMSRFSDMFMPKIYDALIGEGYEHEKQHFPSLKNQLQDSIEHAAATILKEVRK